MNKEDHLRKRLSSVFNRKKNDSNQFSIIKNINIHLIKTNPFQPRTNISTKKLNELVDSIKTYGLIQAITVRIQKNDEYELISGERRLQASKLAGLTEIPAFIKNVQNNQMLEIALVENIQRQDLDPIEIALSLQQLIQEYNITHDTLGKKIGKTRSTISNYIRLLKLDPIIQAGIKDKIITIGHARAIINIANQDLQLDLYQNIIKNKYSVRDTELIAKTNKLDSSEKNQKYKYALSTNFQQIEAELTAFFNQKIKLKILRNGTGKIEIPFKSEKKLDEIIKLLQS